MSQSDLIKSYKERIVANCSKVILGKEEVIEQVLITFVCGGHVLLEDLPGTGKTMLLRSFSRSIGSSFKRIQFTPDLMPSDLTGINYYNQKIGEFEFREGPLFANLILADEINRATPRTQASLLEAMEEHQISVDGTTYPLEEPFMVMATQNPIENYGTFPLPEAQTDRFFMRLHLGYMPRAQEIQVIARPQASILADALQAVVTAEETAMVRKEVLKVTVSDEVAGYLMDIIEMTRKEPSLNCGVSTRGAIALYRASQAKAAFAGRDYVIPEDIRSLAVPVLAHRLGQSASSAETEKMVEDLVAKVAVPLETI